MLPIRTRRLSLIVCLSLALVACSKRNSIPEGVSDENRGVIVKSLEDAAKSVALSLNDLAVISKAEHPPIKVMPLTKIKSEALTRPLSLTWYGPIAPALDKVAKAVDYRLQVYGKPPKTPILVNVGGYHDDMTALELIRDVDIQAGLNASVLIFPKQKVISLRYDAS